MHAPQRLCGGTSDMLDGVRQPRLCASHSATDRQQCTRRRLHAAAAACALPPAAATCAPSPAAALFAPPRPWGAAAAASSTSSSSSGLACWCKQPQPARRGGRLHPRCSSTTSGSHALSAAPVQPAAAPPEAPQPPPPQQQQEVALAVLSAQVEAQQATIVSLQQELASLRQQVTASGLVPAQAGQPQRPYSGSYKGMTIADFRALPDKIIMVRHAESQGNVDAMTYCNTPDYEVPLSARGWEQAVACGHGLRQMMEAEYGSNFRIFFMTSPYCRTRQTFVGVRQAFPDENFAGVQEEVQLREQDFGNFQDPVKIKADLAERNKFGRFYYRFPDGESGSDVFNRISIFEDHLIRDMKAGKFSHNTSLCMITHGLTMRVFLMRFFNWTVESFLQVYNPPNATPIIVEKISEDEFAAQNSALQERRQTLQVKHAYRLRKDSKASLKISLTATMENIDLIGQEYH